MKLAPTNARHKEFESVSEQDAFLRLWKHRFDYLWAAHTDPGVRPEWQTESRHPLSDRLLQQGAYLYGVRFGKLTRYCVLDIDRHSAFHPTRDPLAIKRMVAALEAIGLVSYVAVTSSYSGGLHLYFPFEQEQESWAIALVVSTLLENAGLKLKPGQLEIFPNPRPYTNGTPSLYTGHRVPIQAGSYLLNQHWEQVYTDQAAFVQQWQWAAQRNDLNCKTIKRVLKQAQRHRYKVVTGSSQKFLNDLDTDVEPGWTGTGQTNRLLGRIAMREYIFGHILRGGAPLTGQALVDAIVTVAVALPGYTEWCRHQHEIHKLARNWARDIEASPNYYPYDPSKRRKSAPQSELEPRNNIVSFNQQLALDAAQRIQAAIATLQADGIFPSGATARAEAIIAIARCSNQTLHKYKTLWHPDSTEQSVGTVAEAVTGTSGNPAALPPETLKALPVGGVHPFHPNKFVANPAALPEQAEKLQEAGGFGGGSTGETAPVPAAETTLNPEKPTTNPEIDPSPLPEPEIAVTNPEKAPTEQAVSAPSRESNPNPLLQPQSLSGGDLGAVTSAVTGAAATIAQRVTEKHQRQAATHLAKMTWWLTSGDPILVKEAEAWFAAQVEPSQLQTKPPDPGGWSDNQYGERG